MTRSTPASQKAAPASTFIATPLPAVAAVAIAALTAAAFTAPAQAAPDIRFHVVVVGDDVVRASQPGQGLVGSSGDGRAVRAVRWREGADQAVELPSGGHGARATHLAAGGAVAGSLRASDGTHAVRWNAGDTMDVRPVAGESASWPTGLATDGTMTAYAFDADGTARHGFVVAADGTRRAFPAWGTGDVSMPMAISPSGWVAAVANETAGGTRRCVRAAGGVIEPLPLPPQALWCSPVGINDAGHVVATIGQAPVGNWRAVFWDGTTWTDLGDLGGDWVRPLGLNAGDVVVGMSRKQTKQEEAFVWKDGAMHPLDLALDDSGADLRIKDVHGIDDAGRIAATVTWLSHPGTTHVLLVPVAGREVPR